MQRANDRQTRATLAVLAIVVLAGCVSNQTATRNTEPADDAGDQNFMLGAQYYRNGNFDLARDRLERALTFDDRSADTWSLLALTLAQLDKQPAGCRCLRQSHSAGTKQLRRTQCLCNLSLPTGPVRCGRKTIRPGHWHSGERRSIRHDDQRRCLRGEKTGSGAGRRVLSSGA